MPRSWAARLAHVEVTEQEARLAADAAWLTTTYGGGSPADYLATLRRVMARTMQLARVHGAEPHALAAALAAEFSCTPTELLARAQEIAEARGR